MVTYTDPLGVVRARNVGLTLNVAGVAGDIISGELSVAQNGATNILIQTTGVVTPGALSYRLDATAWVLS